VDQARIIRRPQKRPYPVPDAADYCMAYPVFRLPVCCAARCLRYAFRMAREPEPIEFPETTTIATIGEAFVIMAECKCGNAREMYTLFLRRQLGAGVTLGKVRQKLRCHRCQARMPEIRIYRRLR
jgi:hypothetical protein